MTRRYHAAMSYACDGAPVCQQEVLFYLEEGCEGPRSLVVEGVVVAGAAALSGSGKVTVGLTHHRRFVVPVPFIAGRCPRCAQEPCSSCRSHRRPCSLSHVRWGEDQTFDPMLPESLLPDGAARFLYPSPEEFERLGDRACGKPVFEGSGR